MAGEVHRRRFWEANRDKETGERERSQSELESQTQLVNSGSATPYLLLLGAVICLEIFLVLSAQLFQEPKPRVGAVVADHVACSKVGRNILLQGGSAVDAAIATLLCTGVRQPQSMGIGGGSYFVIYDNKLGKAVTINGRETVPLKYAVSPSERGSAAVAVPAELRTYKAAHDLYGRLPWKELFQPAIKMARRHRLSKSTAKVLKFLRKGAATGRFDQDIQALYGIFSMQVEDEPAKNHIVSLKSLEKTLKKVSEIGPDYIYNSSITETIVKEMQETGGFMSVADFQNYRPIIQEATLFNLKGMKFYTSDDTSAGSILGLTLKMIEGLNLTSANSSSSQLLSSTLHYWIEIIKIATGLRMHVASIPQLKDRNKVTAQWQSEIYASQFLEKIDRDKGHSLLHYLPDTDVKNSRETDHTSHVSVLSPDGDAVSVTSSIGLYFGAGLVSQSTGIIWNSHLQNYTYHESGTDDVYRPKKKILEPGERRMSTMAPVIMVDRSGEVRLVAGASGGHKILTSQIQVLSRLLWLDESVESAILAPRFNYVASKEQLEREGHLDEDTLIRLQDMGHNPVVNHTYLGSVMAIYVHDNGTTSAFADKRKPPGKAVLVVADDN